MHVNVDKELAALGAMTMPKLRVKYAQVFGQETRMVKKAWLIKRIIWRLQALGEGDLSDRARERAAELAQDANLRLLPPRKTKGSHRPGRHHGKSNQPDSTNRYLPMPGTILMRWYKGKTLSVQVLRHGFEYEDQVYKSLSAVAKAITGSHTSGFLFFQRSLLGKGTTHDKK